jgi:hypothetical protein
MEKNYFSIDFLLVTYGDFFPSFFMRLEISIKFCVLCYTYRIYKGGGGLSHFLSILKLQYYKWVKMAKKINFLLAAVQELVLSIC